VTRRLRIAQIEHSLNECSGPGNPSSLAVEARQLNFRFAD
jgi:hypothetical protein